MAFFIRCTGMKKKNRKSERAANKRKEENFDLRLAGPANEAMIPQYNALKDKHLSLRQKQYYFGNKKMLKQLRKAGLLIEDESNPGCLQPHPKPGSVVIFAPSAVNDFCCSH